MGYGSLHWNLTTRTFSLSSLMLRSYITNTFISVPVLLFITRTVPIVVAMASSSSSSYKSNNPAMLLSDDLIEELTSQVNDFAAARGLQVEHKDKVNDDGSKLLVTAPISLFPNAYPASSFRRGQILAPSFNLLVERISRDAVWLNETLSDTGVADVDPFTGRLLKMFQDIYCVEGAGKFAKKADRLGILRSDYMLHNNNELKQVELNTIASSFAGLAATVANFHRQLVTRVANEDESIRHWLEENKKAVLGSSSTLISEEDGVPENPALTCLPSAMNVAHRRYIEKFGVESSAEPVVLFVVQDGETNTVDQRMLELELALHHQISVVRMSLTSGYTNLLLNESDGSLKVLLDDGTAREVSLAYFRAGYAPTDYPGKNDEEWATREKIELSRATKCPCLGYHLAGTKKVQQALARPGNVERFFSGDELVNITPLIREAFAGLFSLGADATEFDKSAVNDALSGNEANYVLKPQREGGGYNFYSDRLATKLRENVSKDLILSNELAEFILMERLFPPKQMAYLLRSGKVEGYGESISELGCFGTIVSSDDGEVLHNEYSGFLLRTKFSGVDEGGVASGFATLSSPYLCN